MLSPITLLHLLLFIFHAQLLHISVANGYVFVYSGCSGQKFQPNTSYETNLNSLISSLVTSSSRSLYNALAIGNSTDSSSDAATFGLFQCRSDLKLHGCSACIAVLMNQLQILCPYSDGASLQLDGCFLRYERIDFIGKLDTGLRYNKCSPTASNQAEFLQRRDEVFADLLSVDGFRISTAGTVQGFGQCLGDLDPADCSSCLAEAVDEVKSLCGSAAGDVYLAQCYVRYWESGYYSTPITGASSYEDGMGKTVAIIIGVVAGAAILVVVLAICKKALR